MATLSRLATNGLHGENSAYFDGWTAYQQNPFHPTHNPHGIIQMGLAENQMCFDQIEDWMKKNPEASICTPEGVEEFREIANFQDYNGLPEFRQGVAKFMSKARGGRVRFDPDRIVMAGGATGANELITFCIADPGDAYLVPTPYYPAFNRDLGWRTGVKLFPVKCYSSNNFQITKLALEQAYQTAIQSKINIKGLIITNPSNPLGTTLSKQTLTDIVQFITDHNIHLVVDEIYAATVFNSPKFISIAEIIEEVECNRDNIHIIYSLSKDMGLPGFRIGIVYSYNRTVENMGRKMSSFGLVSSQTQYLLASMLNDDAFVDNFLAESSKRLAKRYYTFTKGLEHVGITCLKSNGGLFFWMNLKHLMKEQTVEGEMKLWKTIVHDVKLNVSPGSSFSCTEPGWFRVCFANMDDETVQVALQRIRVFVGSFGNLNNNNKRWHENNLRLSFSNRIYEESVTSPHIMSPHSSIPHSPLVRART